MKKVQLKEMRAARWAVDALTSPIAWLRHPKAEVANLFCLSDLAPNP
jgi:hypothetical protein